ncbi:MAG: FAD-dependent oxidoreductase [Candidatus Aenigmarchaeota archaeon]|nr:FAD-dependent oxidoreductase [Candidatus Aenigmarchaeota archaeon]
MELYDIIIIGAGITGYAGAVYAGRLKLKTLVIGKERGGIIVTTDVIENYPGFKSITGAELAAKVREHAMEYRDNVKFVDDIVERIEKRKGCFIIHTESRKEYRAISVLYATGTKHKKLDVPGEKEFFAKGVHTCGLCDGAFYKDKIVAVVGGSDSAAKEAVLLTQWAKKVYIIYRKEKIRAEPANMEKIDEKIKEGKIEIINNTNIKEIIGDRFVKRVVLDRPYKGSVDFPVNGIFLSVGIIPISDLAHEIGIDVNEKGEIIINRYGETNLPGFFAAGDVTDKAFKQAITGVGDAVSAVYSAYNFTKQRGRDMSMCDGCNRKIDECVRLHNR